MPFSIMIPVYNEEEIMEKNVKRLTSYLDKMGKDYEILICSNGSTDNTVPIGKSLDKENRRIRFFSLKDRGVGLAFRSNVRNAKYEKLVSLDMDLSIDLSFVEKCERLLDYYSIVVGSKQVGKQERSWMRKFLSDGYIKLSKALLGLDFSDYSIAAKGYRKSEIKDSLDDIDYGSSYVIELIYKNRKRKIKEIPVSCHDVRGSKFNIFHEVLYRFKNLSLFFLKVKWKRV